MSNQKVRWIKQPANSSGDMSEMPWWPRYEQEVLTYKDIPGNPIVFNADTTDEVLEHYGFYRIVANTMPIVSNQTYDPCDGTDPVAATEPFQCTDIPEFAQINGRTYHMHWISSELTSEELMTDMVQKIESAKTTTIAERPITWNSHTFEWKVRDVVYWRELLNSMSDTDTVDIYSTTGTVINGTTKAQIQEIVDVAAAARLKLENLATAYLTEANAMTNMEKYNFYPIDTILDRWDAA